MRWEKTGDFESVFRQIASLHIPGELRYRWALALRKRKSNIPPLRHGLESVLGSLFVGLVHKRQVAEEAKVLSSLVAQILLAQSQKEANVTQSTVDKIIYYFWKWQRHFNPAVPAPQTATTEDLEGQMDALKHIFESSAGFAVKPTDTPLRRG